MDTKVNAVNNLLAQMRSMAVEAQGKPAEPNAAAGAAGGFSDLLKQSIEAVNASSQNAGALQDAFVRGEPGVQLAEVMVAMQKSSVSFQAMTQVRNKLVQAYEEIMRMQV